MVFSEQEGSLVPKSLEERGVQHCLGNLGTCERMRKKDFVPERNLTVRDIMKLRDKHGQAL